MYCENCGSIDIEQTSKGCYKCLQCGKVYKGKAECLEPDLEEEDGEGYPE